MSTDKTDRMINGACGVFLLLVLALFWGCSEDANLSCGEAGVCGNSGAGGGWDESGGTGGWDESGGTGGWDESGGSGGWAHGWDAGDPGSGGAGGGDPYWDGGQPVDAGSGRVDARPSADSGASGGTGGQAAGGTGGQAAGGTGGQAAGGTGGQAAGGAGGTGGEAGGTGGEAGGTGGEGGQAVGGEGGEPGGNTNIALSGSQDLGYFRRLLEADRVPTTEDFGSEGFFSEHHTPLPHPDCGEVVCLQAMLGVMGNLLSGDNLTLLQIGLNSPLVADPDARPPLNLTVVVDTSGSMAADEKMVFVQQGMRQMIQSLHDEDRLAIIDYDTDVVLVVGMRPVGGNRRALTAALDELGVDGGTNLFGGLEAGYQEAMRSYDSGRQNRVILLSDGQPTRGNTDEAEILAMSATYNQEGIGVTTIGLGLDFNLPLMRGLAEQGDGNFYFVEDAPAVREVFTEELSFFTVPVAYDVYLEMRQGSDYQFVRAHGSRKWQDFDAGDGGWIHVPSVFLAHRMAHDDVGPGDTRRGGGSALLVELMPVDDPQRAPGDARVATVNLRFREPGTDRVVQSEVQVTYPYHPLALARGGFFENRIVEKSFVMLNIYLSMVAAVDRFHAQNGALALNLLARIIAAAEDYEDSANQGEGDEDIRLDVVLLRRLVAVMESNGARPPEQADIPDDPWPAD